VKSAQSPSVWDQVLILLVFGVGAYALGLVFAGEFIGDQLFDRLGFGPSDGGITGGVGRDYARFIYGVLGAVIMGWMITIGAIAMGPLRKREVLSLALHNVDYGRLRSIRECLPLLSIFSPREKCIGSISTSCGWSTSCSSWGTRGSG